MARIATSIEESKMLLELGIDPNTADMRWRYNYNIHKHDDITQALAARNWDDPYNKDIPAWSLGALLEVIPKEVKIKGQRYAPCLFPIIDGHWLYELWYNSIEIIESPIAVWCDNPVDACYKMILKLHKNKLL